MDPGIGGERSDGSPADAESAASQLGRALDDLGHRFDRRDLVELAATVVLSAGALSRDEPFRLVNRVHDEAQIG